MNADFQAAYPRLSAVILIVPTCNVTVSKKRLLFKSLLKVWMKATMKKEFSMIQMVELINVK
jgi:hypothetical protein